MSAVIILPEYGPPFSPGDVPNMLFWHDFSDISTLFQDVGGTTPVTTTGDPIGLVLDKKPIGTPRNLTGGSGLPPTYDAAGQNGLGTVKFDHVGVGDEQQLRHAGALVESSPFTYFIAATTPHNATLSVVVSQNGCGGNLFQYYANSSPVRVYNGVILDTTLPYATFRTVTVEADVTTTVWNQTTIDTTGNMGVQGQSAHMLGAHCSGSPDTGGIIHIGEVMEFSIPPSASDRLKIQNYLINKWGA